MGPSTGFDQHDRLAVREILCRAGIRPPIFGNFLSHLCGRVWNGLFRGDRTAVKLFIAGIQGWEAGLGRRLDHGKSKPNGGLRRRLGRSDSALNRNCYGCLPTILGASD